MVIFLSTGMLEELSRRLVEGGYQENTPAAIVYKATWADEKKYVCTVGSLAQTAREHGITKTALIIVGDVFCRNSIADRIYTIRNSRQNFERGEVRKQVSEKGQSKKH